MRRKLELDEVKELYKGWTVYEMDTCYIVKALGRHDPDIDFILTKDFTIGNDGEPVDPCQFENDWELTKYMGIDFDGDVSYLFGDFFHSKKGSACFRPKNPIKAQHLLICVSWGRNIRTGLGISKEQAHTLGALFYRYKPMKDHKNGWDYLVLPVEYRHVDRSEYDADNEINAVIESVRAEHLLAIRRKVSSIRKSKGGRREKITLESVSDLENTGDILKGMSDRLSKVMKRLDKINVFYEENHRGKVTMSLYNAYFVMDGVLYSYAEDNIQKAEDWIVELEHQAYRARLAKNGA